MTGVALVRGLGSIGRRHADVLASMGYEVLGWPVRDRSAGPGDPRVVDDTTALRLVPEVDLVVVSTDTSRHVADTLQALEHGARRVLIEKPLAPSVPHAAALLAHPGASERVVVAAPLRAHRGFDAFRSAVAALGGPKYATVVSQSWLPSWRPDRDYRSSYSARAEEGGALRDLVHEIDYAVMAIGAPRSLTAVLDRDGPLDMEAEQGATLLWSTDAGDTVTVRIDYLTRPPRRGALVTSAHGSVAWNPLSATVTTVAPDGTTRASTTPEDLDRNNVMRRQARATIGLPAAAALKSRLAAGAPATLAEATLAVRICDDARSTPSGGAATR